MLFKPNLVVDTKWLNKRLNRDDLIIMDASWHMPAMNRDPANEFERHHIPGAAFFDHDAIVDPESLLPHALPSEQLFADKVSALGASNERTIVVYDAGTTHAAARAWWMFTAFGHTKVYVLDGGLDKWRRDGYPVETGPAQTAPRRFEAKIDPMLLRSADDIIANLMNEREQIIDARGKPRFDGTVPEPREGLRSGHIPNSINLPFGTLYTDEGTMKSTKEISEIFKEAGVDLDKPAVTTCGSGITASSIFLALNLLGKRDVALYDGSWSEWGGLGDEAPVSTNN